MIVEPNDVLIHMYNDPGQLNESSWITILASGFTQYLIFPHMYDDFNFFAHEKTFSFGTYTK